MRCIAEVHLSTLKHCTKPNQRTVFETRRTLVTTNIYLRGRCETRTSFRMIFLALYLFLSLSLPRSLSFAVSCCSLFGMAITKDDEKNTSQKDKRVAEMRYTCWNIARTMIIDSVDYSSALLSFVSLRNISMIEIWIAVSSLSGLFLRRSMLFFHIAYSPETSHWTANRLTSVVFSVVF